MADAPLAMIAKYCYVVMFSFQSVPVNQQMFLLNWGLGYYWTNMVKQDIGSASSWYLEKKNIMQNLEKAEESLANS